MKKKIGIVGAAGKMGKWFSGYFATRGDNLVYVYDTRKEYGISITGVIHCNTLKQCVIEADYVIICVPNDKTSVVIKKVAAWMKKGSALLEISSIKNDVIKSLIKVPKSLIPISIHPMFGPGARELSNSKILFIPVRSKKQEEQKLKSILGDAKILVVNGVGSHDRLMALILGLIFFVNLVIASVISKENSAQLKKYSGTSYALQSILFHSILLDDVSLISSILLKNAKLKPYLKDFVNDCNNLFETIHSEDRAKLETVVKRLKRHYCKENEIERSYAKLYSLFQKAYSRE